MGVGGERVLKERVIPFRAGDGFQCNLIHIQGERPPTRGPVLLVHGAGVRANIFRAPVKTTLVDTLVERGYDVWLENWRASIDLPPNRWTLDQAAVYDHPVAVKTVLRETGATEMKAVIHCQGSTSFMMSAVAGLVPQVKTILSNAVSLHPDIPWIERVKSFIALPIVSALTPFLNPQGGLHADGVVPKMVDGLVKLTHHECDNPVCKHASFTYGTGFPVLWRHENLNSETHEWLKHEFAHVPMTFFQHMDRCVRAGHLASVGGFPCAAAANERAIRLFRRRKKHMLSPREPAAHPRFFPEATQGLPLAARTPGLRTPRRVHRQRRCARRVSHHAGRIGPTELKEERNGHSDKTRGAARAFRPGGRHPVQSTGEHGEVAGADGGVRHRRRQGQGTAAGQRAPSVSVVEQGSAGNHGDR